MSYATDLGFVIGKKYVLANAIDGEGHHRFDYGDVVEFISDDKSRSPQFRRVSDNKTAYITLARLEPAEEVVEPPVAVNVSLNGNSTTIVVQRNLTADEVAAVLKAINA